MGDPSSRADFLGQKDPLSLGDPLYVWKVAPLGKTRLEGEALLGRPFLEYTKNNFKQADVQHEFLILNVKASAKTFVKEK